MSLLTSCSSLRQQTQLTGITQYADILRALDEPVDIRPELWKSQDTYIRFLYLPPYSEPICITVRAGAAVPSQAIVRTQVLQTGRGIPLSEEWEPNYSRVLFSSDSLIDIDTLFILFDRLAELKADSISTRPIEFEGIGGALCILEQADSSNDYFFMEVWSPNISISHEDQEAWRNFYSKVYPDKTMVDFESINKTLQHTVNVLNWFAEQSDIEELEYKFKFKKESFQQEN